MKNVATARLTPIYFDLIAKGIKTVEGRVNKAPLNTLQPGDILKFIDRDSPDRSIDTQVVYVKTYPSFREMLQKEGLELCLPGITSLDEGVAIYHQFPGYEEAEKTLGALAIKITLIS